MRIGAKLLSGRLRNKYLTITHPQPRMNLLKRLWSWITSPFGGSKIIADRNNLIVDNFIRKCPPDCGCRTVEVEPTNLVILPTDAEMLEFYQNEDGPSASVMKVYVDDHAVVNAPAKKARTPRAKKEVIPAKKVVAKKTTKKKVETPPVEKKPVRRKKQ